MALNRKLVGRRYPPAPLYEVCREHLRDYATAIGDHNPAYHNVESAMALGHRDIIAAPTYAFTLTMRAMARAMFDPDLGLEYARVVHGEQHFDFRRPITAGDVLAVHAAIEAITARGSHEYLTTRCQIMTADGELVAETREVIVSRGSAA
jgi:acyl dehydratase